MSLAASKVEDGKTARFSDYLELTKPRLSLLSVATALVGYAAARPPWLPGEFFALCVGTSLCAAGVAAVNQWMEADTDARMKRTAERPLQRVRSPTDRPLCSVGC